MKAWERKAAAALLRSIIRVLDGGAGSALVCEYQELPKDLAILPQFDGSEPISRVQVDDLTCLLDDIVSRLEA